MSYKRAWKKLKQQTCAATINVARNRESVNGWQLGGDPKRTNAMAVRKVVGSGGFNTIQKHLETLRAEQASPKSEKGQETPPYAPEETIQGNWAAEWSEASRAQGKAISDALQRIAELEDRLSIAVKDLKDATEEMDQLRTDREEAVARAKAAEHALEIEQQVMAGERAALDNLMDRMQRMMPTPN